MEGANRYTITLNEGDIEVRAVDATAEESPLLTHEDQQFLATLIAPSRRRQWSTARTILREKLGHEASLRYTSRGALLLDNPIGTTTHLSISHTPEWVAVMLSSKRCGVDIESCGRNFSRISQRYISLEERERLSQRAGEDFEALVWCTKEALYKYGGREGLDFTRDIIITEIDPLSHTLKAELYGLQTPTIHYQRIENHMLCYLSEE